MNACTSFKRDVKLKFGFGIGCIVYLILLLLCLPTATGLSQHGFTSYHQGRQMTSASFKNHFENYYSSNTYLTAQQKEQFEEYWSCILAGQMEHIKQSLRWSAQHGKFDDYFMALNYLVYVHDNHLRSPRLLRLIECLIDESIQQNIIQSSVLLTNSVTYNIVKYLLGRFQAAENRVSEVNYSVINYQRPSEEVIKRLIAELGSSRADFRYHTVIVNFLRQIPSMICDQLDFKLSSRVVLKQILTILLQGSLKISADLRNACLYYFQLFRSQEIEYQTRQHNLQIIRQLMNYIPNFDTPYRQILIECLTQGNLIHELIKLCGRPSATQSYLYQLLSQGISSHAITGRIREAFSFYLNYFHGVNAFAQMSQSLPEFLHSPGKEFYNILVSFMNGSKLNAFLAHTMITHETLTMQTLSKLRVILGQLKTSSYVSTKVKAAAEFYLEFFDLMAIREEYSLDQLFSIIPRPTLAPEKDYFEYIKLLFDSTTFLQVIQQSNIQIVQDHKVMLHEVLNCALQSTLVSMECKRAILHYFKLMYNEGISVEQSQKIEFLLEELQSLEIDTDLFEIMSTFLRSDFAYIIFQNRNFDFTQGSFIILEEICETMTHVVFLDATIITAATTCKTKVHEAYLFETELITKIHHAFTSLEGVSTKITEKYEMDLDVFLQCDEMHTIIRHCHFDINKDARELLYDLLMVIEEDINISIEIREGAYHYTRYILEPLLGNVPCDMEALLKLLPAPTNHITHRYYDVLKTYLIHGVPRFLTSQIDFNKTQIDLLLDILQALVYCDRIPVDVRGTARYYWHFFNTSMANVDVNLLEKKLDKLTLLLPKPTSIHESQYYNRLVNYLKGKTILTLLNTISINLHKPDVRILRDVLVLTLNTKMIYMDVKIVARYYLNMIDTGVIGDVSNIIIEETSGTQHTNLGIVTTPTLTSAAQNYATVGTQAVTSDTVATQTTQATQAMQAIRATQATQATQASQAIRATQATQTTQDIQTKQATLTQATQSQVIQAQTSQAQFQAAAQAQAQAVAQNQAIQAQTLQSQLQAQAQTQATTVQASNIASTASTRTATTATTAMQSQLESGATVARAVTTAPSSSSLTAQQQTVMQKIEAELVNFNVEQASQQAMQNYLHTAQAYKVLETSGVNLEASGSNLLAEFVQVAAHTNDIPSDVRQASEKYELVIPSLKSAVSITPHSQLLVLDKIFHSIVMPAPEQQSVNFRICYNAIDRYLHTEVPTIILQGPHINLKLVPLELLQDIITISQECAMSTESIEIIKNLMSEKRETYDVVYGPTLDHYYRLHKIFQLIPVPTDQQYSSFYFTMDSFLRSNTIYEILQSTEVDFNVELRELLQKIFTLTINASSLSNDIIQAAIYFNNLMFTPTVEKELDIVFHLVPQPMEDKGLEAYETVNEFMHSSQAVEVAQNVNFDTHRLPRSILTNVLDLTSHNSKVAENVRSSASYLLNSIAHNAIQTTASTIAQQTMFSHSSVHSMQSVTAISKKSVTSSKYVTLLNILPESYTTGQDYAVLKDFFAHLTATVIESLLTQEEISLMGANEEALLRLILLKFVHDSSQADNVRAACAHFIKQRYFDFSSYASMIPTASFSEEESYRTMLTQLLTSDEIYRYLDLSATNYEANMESFKIILTKLAVCEQLSMDVRQACGYYLNHAFFDYGTLLDVVPAPTSDSIKRLYTTVSHFLRTKELVNRCTQTINLSKCGGSNELLLHEVLLQAEQCDWLDESIRVAAKYYLTIMNSVAISLRKVMTKTLDLNGIFTDAFDFSSFSRKQFDAYHIFWTFASERTEELLGSPGFDFWMENNKRGEFTTKFLDALSAKADVPAEVMDVIAILKPLVHYDQGGALDV